MKFTLTEVKRSSPYQVALFAGGKRIYRKFFKSKEKAQKFIRDAKKEEAENIVQGRANPQWSGGRCGIIEAIEMYLEWCESRNVRPATYSAYRERLNSFASFAGPRNIDQIKREDVVAFCTQPQLKSPWTQKGYRSDVATFLTWCSEKGWCENQFTKIKLDQILEDEKPIEFLTIEESAILLELCSKGKDAVSHKGRLAVQLFAGVRPDEACRLGSKDINLALRRIHIPGAKAKTRKARTLNGISDNLVEWIKKYPFEPCAYSAWRSARRRAVGYIGHDALRHTFCSYGYWFFGQEKCLRFTGHNDHTIFHRHYVENSVPEEDGKKFFELYP